MKLKKGEANVNKNTTKKVLEWIVTEKGTANNSIIWLQAIHRK